MKYLVLATLALAPACASDPQPFAPVPLHEATLPVSRPDSEWWLERNELLCARAQEAPRLVFLGDSITQGWEGEGREVWARDYQPRKAVNLGIGGDRTQHVLWRLENGNFDGISPEVVVVMIGTNNSGDDSPEHIADGVTAIVAKLYAELPETEILLLAIFPRGADAEDEQRRTNDRANERIAALGEAPRVHFLDIGPAFLEPNGTLSTEIMPDLLHLSPGGYEIWAESMEPTLATLLDE